MVVKRVAYWAAMMAALLAEMKVGHWDNAMAEKKAVQKASLMVD